MVLGMPHVYIYLLLCLGSQKIDSKGIFMFSRSTLQADRWLSIKTMHFLVFCIISVKIKRLSETPALEFLEENKDSCALGCVKFWTFSHHSLSSPFPAPLSPIRISLRLTLTHWHVKGCCHPPHCTSDTEHTGDLQTRGVMVTHLFNWHVTDLFNPLIYLF